MLYAATQRKQILQIFQFTRYLCEFLSRFSDTQTLK